MNVMWYRQFWPWFIIALPLTAIIASIYSLVIAFKYQDPVLQDNWYQEGDTINVHLQQDRRAQELNLNPSLKYNPENGIFTVRFNANKRLPNELLIDLEHPLDSQKDLHLILQAVSNNLYEVSLPKNLSGSWYYMIMPQAKDWRSVGQLSFSTIQHLE